VNQEITEELANQVQGAGIERVRIRSVLTCESRRGVCALCYGVIFATAAWSSSEKRRVIARNPSQPARSSPCARSHRRNGYAGLRALYP